jgi:uncharacterized protein (DUF2237 family)
VRVTLVHADRQADMAKLMGTFCECANGPKMTRFLYKSYGFFETNRNQLGWELLCSTMAVDFEYA